MFGTSGLPVLFPTLRLHAGSCALYMQCWHGRILEAWCEHRSLNCSWTQLCQACIHTAKARGRPHLGAAYTSCARLNAQQSVMISGATPSFLPRPVTTPSCSLATTAGDGFSSPASAALAPFSIFPPAACGGSPFVAGSAPATPFVSVASAAAAARAFSEPSTCTDSFRRLCASSTASCRSHNACTLSHIHLAR